MPENFYDLLGVDEDATKTEIKAAYRKRAREYHPDVNDDDQAGAQFKTVRKAYEVLSNADKRAAYDRMGHVEYVNKRLNGLPNDDLFGAGSRWSRSGNRSADGSSSSRRAGGSASRGRDTSSAGSGATASASRRRSSGGSSSSGESASASAGRSSSSSRRSSTSSDRTSSSSTRRSSASSGRNSTSGTDRRSSAGNSAAGQNSSASTSASASTRASGRNATAGTRASAANSGVGAQSDGATGAGRSAAGASAGTGASAAASERRQRARASGTSTSTAASPLRYGWVAVLLATALYTAGLLWYLRANAGAAAAFAADLLADPTTALVAPHGLSSPAAFARAAAAASSVDLLFPAGAAALSLTLAVTVYRFGRGTAWLYVAGGAAPLVALGAGPLLPPPAAVDVLLVVVLPVLAALAFLGDVGRFLFSR